MIRNSEDAFKLSIIYQIEFYLGSAVNLLVGYLGLFLFLLIVGKLYASLTITETIVQSPPNIFYLTPVSDEQIQVPPYPFDSSDISITAVSETGTMTAEEWHVIPPSSVSIKSYNGATIYNCLCIVWSAGLLSIVILLIVQIRTIFVLLSARIFGVKLPAGSLLKLWQVVDDVVATMHEKKIDHIYVVPDTFIGAIETNFLPFLPYYRRNLIIGYVSLLTLSEQQLKAVIAHELAHFQLMSLNRALYKISILITNSAKTFIWWQKTSTSIHEATKDSIFIYVGMLVKFSAFISAFALYPYFKWVDQFKEMLQEKHKDIYHETELFCDRVGAGHFGANNILQALIKINLAEYAFQHYLSRYGPKVREINNYYPLFCDFLDGFSKQYKHPENMLMTMETENHPSLQIRMENLTDLDNVEDNTISIIDPTNRSLDLEDELSRYIRLTNSYFDR